MAIYALGESLPAGPPFSLGHCFPFAYNFGATGSLFEDSPRFQIGLDAERSEFAADAGMLESAERRLLIIQQAIDRYPAGSDLRCDATCALKIRAAHVSVEAVLRIIGDPNRILVILVGDDRENGAENLFLGKPMCKRREIPKPTEWRLGPSD